MNQKQAKDLLPVIQAFAEGKEIQRSILKNEWFKWDGDVRELDNPHIRFRVKPEKQTRWVNIYAHGLATHVATKALADDVSSLQRIACIKVEFEEGEGL